MAVSSHSRPHVLVVDDQLNWLDVIGDVLANRCDVVFASSYDEAKQKLRENEFDVLVADQRLSDSDRTNEQGLLLADEVIQLGLATEVIVLTGYPSPYSARRAFKKGAYDYVVKYGEDGRSFDFVSFRELVVKAADKAVSLRTRQAKASSASIPGLLALEVARSIEPSPASARRFLESAGFGVDRVRELTAQTDRGVDDRTSDLDGRTDAEFFLVPVQLDRPLARWGAIYARIICGRAPSANDFSSVCDAAREFYGGERADLPHRVALVFSGQRPEPGARYRLYEIRQREGLSIVLLDSSALNQASSNRSPEEVLIAEIDQATGQQNLYAISGPVSGDLSFFGRERVLQEVDDLLKTGQPVAIFGLRKMGKTSLVQRLQTRLGQRRPVAFLDTQGSVRQQGAWPFYHLIVDAFVTHLQRSRPDVTIPLLRLYPHPPVVPLSAAAAFMEDMYLLHSALGSPAEADRMVLIIDEVDRLLPYGASSGYEGFASFLGQLRAANQQARLLDFSVVGVDPALNRNERWQNSDNELYRSLQEIWMPRMSFRDAQEMVESLGSQMGVRYSPEALRLLVQAGSGHPYVTRQICSLIVGGRLGRGAINVSFREARAAINQFIYRDTYLSELWRVRLSDIQRDLLRRLAQSSDSISMDLLLPVSHRQDVLSALLAMEDYTVISHDHEDYVIAWEIFRRWIRLVELGLKD